MPSSLPAQAQQPTSAHTAGRLTVAGDQIRDDTGGVVAVVIWPRKEANAARLALAWNSHDELVAMLTRLVAFQVQPKLSDGALAHLASGGIGSRDDTARIGTEGPTPYRDNAHGLKNELDAARALLAKLTQPTA